MNYLFLCSRLAGYFYNSIRVLVESDPDIVVMIIARPNAENAPFQYKAHERITIQSRNDFQVAEFVNSATNFAPDYVYISGWSDNQYRLLGKSLKNKCPVVMGMDNQWKGLWKQRVMEMFGAVWLNSFCSYIWVPGVRQYEYARRIGFTPPQIISGLYTADVDRFQKITSSAINPTKEKSLLFMGNMWQEKGVVELVSAFQNLSNQFPHWRLKLVGGGPLVDQYKNLDESIEILGFVQPNEMQKLLSGATAFCLPSYHDAWAVVIHEAACMGMPIVATDVCGAVTAFVHDGYNGFLCAPEDEASLQAALKKLMSLPDEELTRYGVRSRQLALQITPEFWASKVTGLTS